MLGHRCPDAQIHNRSECAPKSLSNYRSVNLHNVEETRDVNSWKTWSCCQVRKAEMGAEVRGKERGEEMEE